MRTNNLAIPPKRAPVGVYDTSILCRGCDNVLSPWDKHAQDVLLRNVSEAEALVDGGIRVGWLIHRCDYTLLKLFFISLLWRASVSTHDFYKRIDLKAIEPVLRDMILAKEPGPSETFAVSLSRFDHPAYRGIFDPHRERFDSINYVRFYLAGFVAHIKVDRRPPPEFLSELILKVGAPIVVFARSRNSMDAAVMREIARTSMRWKRGR